jgi:uncharacterized protein YjbJ (UPF0337 family)
MKRAAPWHPTCALITRPGFGRVRRRLFMDDKLEGKWDQGKGKVKEEVGKLGGDKSTEIGGKIDQGKGKLKEGLGDLKEGLHDERVEH